MARALIVGCGCRGRALAEELAGAGYSVRGTTRGREGLAAIEAAGAEAVTGDPDRLNTLTAHLEGVSVLVWLMGSVTGEDEATAPLNDQRLESMIQAIVDTPVRGVVYEGAGTTDPRQLRRGAEVARRVADASRMPLEVVTEHPGDLAAWTAAMSGAVARVLGGAARGRHLGRSGPSGP